MKPLRLAVFALLALAAFAGSAAAQSPAKVYRVGLLSSLGPIPDKSEFGAGLIRGLARHGYTLGGNLAFERRGAEGHPERLPQLVDELVASKVDVIVTLGYPPAHAAKEGTKTVPVVVVFSGDPVGTGLVESLARPGGNVTGLSDVAAELSPKRLELLKETASGLHRVAMLWNADDLGMTLRYKASAAAAQALGIKVVPLGVRAPDDFNGAFAAMEREMPDGILMVADALTNLNRRRVFEFAAAHRVPAIYESDFYVRDGGLMSYGPDAGESSERAADFVARIFKGAKPADLPLEQPTRFNFVINLKTAKALGLALPPSLLSRADEVIE